MPHEPIQTPLAPPAIGPYSQAIRSGSTVYLSGQIALPPEGSMPLPVEIRDQVRRVLENLQAVAQAAHGSLQDTVKLTVYLTHPAHFPLVNEIMAEYFQPPYPARTTVGVAWLPKDALVAMDAVLALG